ncbi:unnamed protein product [Polarella glacialis]|uniref:SAM domain-containing protein n=1 Tax=Polarella glacialis TaxID=89957 RepID=A0A813EL22_POLGL|nr:unnamed protein product [Polarella glacialis]
MSSLAATRGLGLPWTSACPPAGSTGSQMGRYRAGPEAVDPRQWSEVELGRWLLAQGLPLEVGKAFEDHLVNGLVAVDLSKEDLSSMGIVDSLHQRRVILELRHLFGGSIAPSEGPWDARQESLEVPVTLLRPLGSPSRRPTTARPPSARTQPQSRNNCSQKPSPYQKALLRQRLCSAIPPGPRRLISAEEAAAAAASLVGEMPPDEVKAAIIAALPGALQSLADSAAAVAAVPKRSCRQSPHSPTSRPKSSPRRVQRWEAQSGTRLAAERLLNTLVFSDHMHDTEVQAEAADRVALREEPQYPRPDEELRAYHELCQQEKAVAMQRELSEARVLAQDFERRWRQAEKELAVVRQELGSARRQAAEAAVVSSPALAQWTPQGPRASSPQPVRPMREQPSAREVDDDGSPLTGNLTLAFQAAEDETVHPDPNESVEVPLTPEQTSRWSQSPAPQEVAPRQRPPLHRGPSSGQSPLSPNLVQEASQADRPAAARSPTGSRSSSQSQLDALCTEFRLQVRELVTVRRPSTHDLSQEESQQRELTLKPEESQQESELELKSEESQQRDKEPLGLASDRKW